MQKSCGKIIVFSINYPEYICWCLTRHIRASYVEASCDMANMTSAEHSAHKDIYPAQIKGSEAALGLCQLCQSIQCGKQQISLLPVIWCPCSRSCGKWSAKCKLVGKHSIHLFKISWFKGMVVWFKHILFAKRHWGIGTAYIKPSCKMVVSTPHWRGTYLWHLHALKWTKSWQAHRTRL